MDLFGHRTGRCLPWSQSYQPLTGVDGSILDDDEPLKCGCWDGRSHRTQLGPWHPVGKPQQMTSISMNQWPCNRNRFIGGTYHI